jgi:hypothetical protein
MSKVVFVLGAGCSKICGAPLMADFLDVASRLHSTGKVSNQATHFEKVFKAIGALQAVHSKSQLDLNNIESVFNAFEVANTIGKLPGFQVEEIPGVIDSLKKVIVSTIEGTIRFPTQKSYIGAPPPYNSFADLLKYIMFDAFPPMSVSVITFNYDIAMDMALYRAGMGVDYSLESGVSTSSVPLLKLHGSLNWASKADDDTVISLPLDKYLHVYHANPFSESSGCYIPIGNQLQEYFSRQANVEVKAEAVIVPPSWSKAEHHQALSRVWSRAAKELGEAEYMFIIGYSLPDTDAFFRLLYALGTVGDAPFKRIEVFNPDASIRSKFENLMGLGATARFKYTYVDFTRSIVQIRAYFPGRE